MVVILTVNLLDISTGLGQKLINCSCHDLDIVLGVVLNGVDKLQLVVRLLSILNIN